MRIVQTFWTAGYNPLEHSFGWLRPEHNLMSWALSCLCLKKYYNEVALYTDKQGKHILIDLMHLPYTEVNVVYDETLCLPQHWAFAKIKTYSLQKKPFLHIDGDIFLFKPITQDIVNAPLIAQNKETSTEYYRQMMDRLLGESALELPQYIKEGLKEEIFASYNMGVFGGNDLEFIQAYCRETLAIYDMNKAICPDGNFNLLFEQILLTYKAKEKEVPISTIIPQVFNDNGYTVADFCQLNQYNEKWFFHLLGGHKRNKEVIETFVETFMTLHYGYYKLILSLYPHHYHRGITKGTTCAIKMNIDLPIKAYIDFLNKAEKDWNVLSWEDLFDVERRCIEGKRHSYHREKIHNIKVRRNPYLKCFDVPTAWDKEAIQTMRERLSQKEDVPIQRVAIIPTISLKLRKEYVLFDSEYQMLEQLGARSMQVSDLLSELIIKCKSENMRILWQEEIRILLNEGLLIPYN